MLKIVVPAWEDFNDFTGEFSQGDETTLTLEHSLISLSKWESKHHKAYLGNEQKTNEEVIDYIRCMTLTKNVNDRVFYHLSEENIKEIMDYLADPMTATTFSNTRKSSGKSEILTAELIYYYMIAYGIPFSCEKWHLNRLTTLIHVAAIKNSPSKKMGRKQIMSQNQQLNAARRAKHHSQG